MAALWSIHPVLRALLRVMAAPDSALALALGGYTQTFVRYHLWRMVLLDLAPPWDSDRRLNLDVKDMIAAFAENPRLREFARLSDHEMADHEIGGPFVVELFMDLIRRAHSDLSLRNVYLNPRRTDQVLVYHEKGYWEVFPLPDSIRLLLDGVSEKIRPVILTPGLCGQLPLEAQNALAMAGMLYEETPDAYARKARGLMSAHLANMAPQQLQRG
jgi:hypothetical protein